MSTSGSCSLKCFDVMKGEKAAPVEEGGPPLAK